ncbi:MAG: hypothetical protein HY331_03515 [Chloroflexi bacterium]|nr:hypothetical protein [Chloroflexota bacterium]
MAIESTGAAEWDELAAALNAYGVFHVAPTDRARKAVPPIGELYRRLALASDPRLQEAFVVLLLTHPATAGVARAAIDTLTGAAHDRAERRYVAAAALQRMWRTRLALAMGPQPSIPPAYLDELGLPSLEEDFGEAALRRLAEQEQARYGYNAWSGYRSLMDMFLGHCRLRGWGRTRA